MYVLGMLSQAKSVRGFLVCARLTGFLPSAFLRYLLRCLLEVFWGKYALSNSIAEKEHFIRIVTDSYGKCIAKFTEQHWRD